MTGSFNRLLAKAPKRRLQRRGGAWQEGDFFFRGCFREKKLMKRRDGQIISSQWILGSHRLQELGWGGSVVAIILFLTEHYRHAHEIRVRCPDYNATPCLVLFLFDSFFPCRAPFNSSSDFFLDVRPSTFLHPPLRLPSCSAVPISKEGRHRHR